VRTGDLWVPQGGGRPVEPRRSSHPAARRADRAALGRCERETPL